MTCGRGSRRLSALYGLAEHKGGSVASNRNALDEVERIAI